MLHADSVLLRPIQRAELETLYDWHSDVDTWLAAQDAPYAPRSFERFVKWWAGVDVDRGAAWFGIEADGRLVGDGGLTGIDMHNRVAHIGLAIGDRGHRGQGLGRDALAVLSDYGFRLRGLHRLQVDTLATNDAMLRTARSVGYREEGRLRGKAFVAGQFVDEVVLGLLAEEWHGRRE